MPGQFGEEYRISEIPAELRGHNYHDDPPVQPPVNTTVPPAVQAPTPYLDIIRDPQEKNLALAAQLGAASERVRNLENQVKLLDAPRRPWWQRLLFWRKPAGQVS